MSGEVQTNPPPIDVPPSAKPPSSSSVPAEVAPKGGTEAATLEKRALSERKERSYKEAEMAKKALAEIRREQDEWAKNPASSDGSGAVPADAESGRGSGGEVTPPPRGGAEREGETVTGPVPLAATDGKVREERPAQHPGDQSIGACVPPPVDDADGGQGANATFVFMQSTKKLRDLDVGEFHQTFQGSIKRWGRLTEGEMDSLYTRVDSGKVGADSEFTELGVQVSTTKRVAARLANGDLDNFFVMSRKCERVISSIPDEEGRHVTRHRESRFGGGLQGAGIFRGPPQGGGAARKEAPIEDPPEGDKEPSSGGKGEGGSPGTAPQDTAPVPGPVGAKRDPAPATRGGGGVCSAAVEQLIESEGGAVSIEKVNEELPRLTKSWLEEHFDVCEGKLYRKGKGPLKKGNDEVRPAGEVGEGGTAGSASQNAICPWGKMVAEPLLQVDEPRFKRLRDNRQGPASESSQVSSRPDHQGEWDTVQCRHKITAISRQLLEGLDCSSAEEQLPEWIGGQVKKLQRENEWGREQWRRYINWSTRDQKRGSRIRDPNALPKKQVVYFLGCMARGDFWDEDWSDYPGPSYRQSGSGSDDKSHWPERGTRPRERTAGDTGLRSQQEVTPPWREPADTRGLGGGAPGLPHWQALWQAMQPGLPPLAHGYPMQPGFGMLNPLALAPPAFPSVPFPHAQPRGRNTGDWRGVQPAGRSRSVRRYDWPSMDRLAKHEPLDWVCGRCFWVNFSRNHHHCKKCGFGTPPVLGEKPAPGGSVFVKDATGRH